MHTFRCNKSQPREAEEIFRDLNFFVCTAGVVVAGAGGVAYITSIWVEAGYRGWVGSWGGGTVGWLGEVTKGWLWRGRMLGVGAILSVKSNDRKQPPHDP